MLEPPLPLLGMIAFKRNFLFFSNLFDLLNKIKYPDECMAPQKCLSNHTKVVK
jgi:hypothetical protein